ncbi:MAG: hypothetical protein WBC24_07040, partial [Methylovirgula sp.]
GSASKKLGQGSRPPVLSEVAGSSLGLEVLLAAGLAFSRLPSHRYGQRRRQKSLNCVKAPLAKDGDRAGKNDLEGYENWH